MGTEALRQGIIKARTTRIWARACRGLRHRGRILHVYVALQGSSLDSLRRSTKLVSGRGLRGCGPSTLRRRGGLGSRGGCGGRLGGLLLLCLELVEPLGDELDVRRVVESRVEDIPVHMGKYGPNMSPRSVRAPGECLRVSPHGTLAVDKERHPSGLGKPEETLPDVVRLPRLAIRVAQNRVLQ